MSQSPKPDSGSGQSTQLNISPPENEKSNYQDGYANGRNSESNHQNSRAINEQVSGTNNVLSGLLIGILTVSAVGIAVGVIAYSQWNKNPTPTPPPQINNTSEKNTTIERTIDRSQELVPVPQAPPAEPANPANPVNPEVPVSPDRNSGQ